MGPGLFLLFTSIGVCILAYRLGIGHFHNPGTGFISFGTATLLGLMSIGLVLRSFFEAKQLGPKIAWKPLILISVSLVGYGIALNTLGFSITTFLFMVICLRVSSHQRWWLSIIISIVTVICTNLLFVIWLGCRFPKGVFGI